MPVTKTAKRALSVSKRKTIVNKEILEKFEVAFRLAKKTGTAKDIITATSLVDRAAKKGVFHKNKASRVKSTLSKFTKKASSKKGKK